MSPQHAFDLFYESRNGNHASYDKLVSVSGKYQISGQTLIVQSNTNHTPEITLLDEKHPPVSYIWNPSKMKLTT